MALVAQTETTRPLLEVCFVRKRPVVGRVESGADSRLTRSRRPALARNFLLKYLNFDPLDAGSAHLISLYSYLSKENRQSLTDVQLRSSVAVGPNRKSRGVIVLHKLPLLDVTLHR
jgi:hypothetical protein